MKLVLLAPVLEETWSLLFKETFCELPWVYGMLCVSRKEDAAGTMFTNMGMLIHAFRYQGSSGLDERDLHLSCNCLKYLKPSLRCSGTSILKASIFPQGARWAGESRPVFFLKGSILFSCGPLVFPMGSCIVSRACCWISVCPQSLLWLENKTLWGANAPQYC